MNVVIRKAVKEDEKHIAHHNYLMAFETENKILFKNTVLKGCKLLFPILKKDFIWWHK